MFTSYPAIHAERLRQMVEYYRTPDEQPTRAELEKVEEQASRLVLAIRTLKERQQDGDSK